MARKEGYWTGCISYEEYHHCCTSVQQSTLNFLSKTTSSSNQANGCALLRWPPWISSRGTRRSPSLVSLTLSLLMAFFKLSNNSSMRMYSKLYTDQKRSSIHVQLEKTVSIASGSIACIAISTPGIRAGKRSPSRCKRSAIQTIWTIVQDPIMRNGIVTPVQIINAVQEGAY